MFWQSDFVALLLEWFQALSDLPTFCNTWVASQDYVLYGVSPSMCCTSVREILTYVSASISWPYGETSVILYLYERPADVILASVRGGVRLG